MNNLTIGQIVISKQGRDKGKFYIVLSQKEDYWFLIDGDKKTILNPKRKNVKHIQPTDISSGSIGEKIVDNSMPLDSEVKKFIKNLTDKD